MSPPLLPAGWHRLYKLDREESYLDHGAASKSGRILVVGMTDYDWQLESLAGHYLYDLPANVSWAEVARVFRVGSHNAEEPDSNVELVATKLEKVQARIPGRLVFVDGGGMKILFEHCLSAVEYDFMKSLYPEDDMITDGLEKHMSEWSGDDHPLVCLLTNPLLHLWWD